MLCNCGNAGIAVLCLQAVENFSVRDTGILNDFLVGKQAIEQLAAHTRDHVVDLNEHGVAGDLNEHIVEIVIRFHIFIKRVLFIEHVDHLFQPLVLLRRHAVIDGGDVADFDHAAQFNEIFGILLAGEKAHKLKKIACHIVRNERSLALAGLDHTVGREDLDPLAQRRTANVQLSGKISFNRQTITHLQFASLDLAANIIDNQVTC